ncbi:MAG: hypothetical protein ACYTFY_17940, partial [Planctomycetota bacterium]
MLLPLIFTIVSGCCYSFMALGYKMCEHNKGRSSPFVVVFTGAGALFAAGKCVTEVTDWTDMRLWAIGLTMGISVIIAICCIIQANRLGPASVCWIVTNLAILLPIPLSPFLFGEKFFPAVDLLIVASFVLSLYFLRLGMKAAAEMTKDSSSFRYILMLAAVFIFNGSFVICNKVKFACFGDANSAAVIFINYSVSAVLSGIYLILRRNKPFFTWAEIKPGLITGLASCTGTIFYLKAMVLPSSVVFPISAGVGM